MKKLILVFIFIVIVKPQIASAESLATSVSPALITVKTDGRNIITPTIYIQNKTNHNISYDINLIPFKPSDLKNGEPILQNSIDKDYNSLFQNTIITNEGRPITNIVLAPDQKKGVNLEFNLPTTLPNKDYYFTVLFTSRGMESANNSTTVSINQVAAIDVLLTFGKQGSPQGEIKEFSAPSYLNHGPVNFTADVRNNSQNFITAQGNILVKNMFGQTIASFDLKSINVLADSERLFEDTSWNEKFLLGFYTARIEISLSPSGPVLVKETKFLAFPFEYLAFITVLIILVVYLRFRIVKKRKEK